MVPELADFPLVKQWAGLRPSSPDGIPYIGKIPSYTMPGPILDISVMVYAWGRHQANYSLNSSLNKRQSLIQLLMILSVY